MTEQVEGAYRNLDCAGEPILLAKTRRGETKTFSPTYNDCKEFGFFCGDRVQTPKGPAWVVGVHNGDLYFLIDGERGASKWSGCKAEGFKTKNFQLIFSPASHAACQPPQPDTYKASSLGELVNSEAFSDVAFLLDDSSRVYAMRGILVCRSEYFRTLLTSWHKHQDGTTSQVRLPGIARSTFLSILTYLYTGHTPISRHNAAEVVRCADALLLHELKIKGATELMKHIALDTVLDILLLADQLSLNELKAMCIAFLLKHFHVPALRTAFKTFIREDTSRLVMDVVDAVRGASSDVSVDNEPGAATTSTAQPGQSYNHSHNHPSTSLGLDGGGWGLGLSDPIASLSTPASPVLVAPSVLPVSSSSLFASSLAVSSSPLTSPSSSSSLSSASLSISSSSHIIPSHHSTTAAIPSIPSLSSFPLNLHHLSSSVLSSASVIQGLDTESVLPPWSEQSPPAASSSSSSSLSSKPSSSSLPSSPSVATSSILSSSSSSLPASSSASSSSSSSTTASPSRQPSLLASQNRNRNREGADEDEEQRATKRRREPPP